MGVLTFLKGNLKLNVMALLGFELDYFESTVQSLHHNDFCFCFLTFSFNSNHDFSFLFPSPPLSLSFSYTHTYTHTHTHTHTHIHTHTHTTISPYLLRKSPIVLNCGINEFKPQLRYYVHLRTNNTLGKGINPLIALAIG